MRKKLLTSFLASLFCAFTAYTLASGSITSKAPYSSGSGNATVPGTATILPVQAWVDNIEALLHSAGDLNLSSKGITDFSPNLLYNPSNTQPDGFLAVSSNLGASATIDLSINAISSAKVNAILARLKQGAIDDSALGAFTLKLEGGTNGAPTGQGIIDKASLNGVGCTITTN